jgi:hypothetical protein
VAMAPVKSLGIDAINMSETSGKIAIGGLNQEVIMIGHEAIGGDAEMPGFASFADSLQECFIIASVPEDSFSPSSSVEDMIPGVGIFHAKRSRHCFIYSRKDCKSQEQT